MKHFGILFATMTVLETIGIIIFILAPPVESSGTETVALESGATSVGHLSVDMLGGGVISGEYASDSGRPVLFMALDDEQYEDMLGGRAYNPHFSEIASSGEFHVDWGAMEFCHIVVMHAEDTETTEVVQVTYTVSSTDWTFSFIGLGLFGGFGILSGILLIKHGKDKKKETGPLSPSIDVVIFDEGSEK